METTPTQGPRAGSRWPAERETYDDPHTGATVHRLTTRADSRDRHLYFTADGWFDGGEKLLLRCVRNGRANLFACDLETGELVQLTDLPGGVGRPTRVADGETFFGYSADPERYDSDAIVALDVETLELRTVVEKPAGYEDYGFGVDDVLADDEGLLVSLGERTDAEGHEATRASYPHCAVFTVPTDGGDPTLVHEEEHWISHVNASPTDPTLFTYCHEGPWDNVDNRIHVCDLGTDERYRLRETGADEAVGHEFWLADGETVGYHGWRGSREDPESFFGTVRYDDTDRRETPIPVRATHCHAQERDRFVCDGDTSLPHLLLFDVDEEGGTAGPRVLATHAWDADSPHPHARMSPDGETVAFDADPTGDADVFLAEVPEDTATLPELREN